MIGEVSETTHIYTVEELWGEKSRCYPTSYYKELAGIVEYSYRFEWREILRTENKEEATKKLYEGGSDKRLFGFINPQSLNVVAAAAEHSDSWILEGKR